MNRDFAQDIELIEGIKSIPTILDVVCQTTGVGFSAVARVTEERWFTCSVKDDIGFGLKPVPFEAPLEGCLMTYGS
jgi:hypothetical protein